MEAKEAAAAKAVDYIKDNMTVGLGSGSTAAFAIEKLGEKVKGGLTIRAVATSAKTERLAREQSIPVIDPSEAGTPDIGIDGADEVDKDGNLLKGGGGSLLREKIIAFSCQKFYVIVDDSKLVNTLGKFALPVEIVPFGAGLTLQHLLAIGGTPVLRKRPEGKLFISDNGNLIADCTFGEITDPAWLDVKLKMIPGVVETGLFSKQIVTSVLVGYAGGDVKEIIINA